MILVKLEKPIIFDGYIGNELTRIQDLIAENENKNLTEDELRAMVEVVEDQMNLISRQIEVCLSNDISIYTKTNISHGLNSWLNASAFPFVSNAGQINEN